MSQISIIGSDSRSRTSGSSNDLEKNGNVPPRRPKPQVRRNTHPIPLFNHVCEHLTTVAHVCIVAVTLYIFYISVGLNSIGAFEFFNWHPVLYSIGWMLLMTEAVLMITKDNILANRISYTWRVRWHWMMQVVAVSFSLAGFIVVFVYEEDAGHKHFQTAHGLYGLISLIFALIPTCLSGITALFGIKLRKIIPPKINKFIHATCGIISVIFGGVTMVLSLYTGWFGWKTGGNQEIFILCYIAIVFGIVWCLVRPFITFFERLKSFRN